MRTPCSRTVCPKCSSKSRCSCSTPQFWYRSSTGLPLSPWSCIESFGSGRFAWSMVGSLRCGVSSWDVSTTWQRRFFWLASPPYRWSCSPDVWWRSRRFRHCFDRWRTLVSSGMRLRDICTCCTDLGGKIWSVRRYSATTRRSPSIWRHCRCRWSTLSTTCLG